MLSGNVNHRTCLLAMACCAGGCRENKQYSRMVNFITVSIKLLLVCSSPQWRSYTEAHWACAPLSAFQAPPSVNVVSHVIRRATISHNDTTQIFISLQIQFLVISLLLTSADKENTIPFNAYYHVIASSNVSELEGRCQ